MMNGQVRTQGVWLVFIKLIYRISLGGLLTGGMVLLIIWCNEFGQGMWAKGLVGVVLLQIGFLGLVHSIPKEERDYLGGMWISLAVLIYVISVLAIVILVFDCLVSVG